MYQIESVRILIREDLLPAKKTRWLVMRYIPELPLCGPTSLEDVLAIHVEAGLLQNHMWLELVLRDTSVILEGRQSW